MAAVRTRWWTSAGGHPISLSFPRVYPTDQPNPSIPCASRSSSAAIGDGGAEGGVTTPVIMKTVGGPGFTFKVEEEREIGAHTALGERAARQQRLAASSVGHDLPARQAVSACPSRGRRRNSTASPAGWPRAWGRAQATETVRIAGLHGRQCGSARARGRRAAPAADAAAQPAHGVPLSAAGGRPVATEGARFSRRPSRPPRSGRLLLPRPPGATGGHGARPRRTVAG